MGLAAPGHIRRSLGSCTVDRHKIWRIVRSNYQELKDGAPDGYQAVVDVYLLGRPMPVRLDVVQTTRDREFPWVFLVPEGDSEVLPGPSRRILVPEQHIERIEIYLERLPGESARRQSLGFSYEVIEDPVSNDE